MIIIPDSDIAVSELNEALRAAGLYLAPCLTGPDVCFLRKRSVEIKHCSNCGCRHATQLATCYECTTALDAEMKLL